MADRVAVVGAGVIGLCSAFELRKRGYEVTVFDENAAGFENCSHGNGGMIVPSHFTPIANPEYLRAGLKCLLRRESPIGIRPSWESFLWSLKFLRASTAKRTSEAEPLIRDMHWLSREIYREWDEELGGAPGFEHAGLLHLCCTQEGLASEAEYARKASQLGLQTRVLNEAEVRALEPNAEITVAGGVLIEDDARIRPQEFMASIREKLSSMGVEIHFGSPIRRASELLSSNQFVILSCGAKTASVAREFGIRLPLLPGKGYGIEVPASGTKLHHSAILCEARIAVTPFGQSTRFVSGLELGRWDSEPEGPKLRWMTSNVQKFLPQFSSDILNGSTVWTGHRPCLPDGLPAIGMLRSEPRVAIATGHAMMGMSLGPISGQIVADLVQGGPPAVDMTLLNPNRYA